MRIPPRVIFSTPPWQRQKCTPLVKELMPVRRRPEEPFSMEPATGQARRRRLLSDRSRLARDGEHLPAAPPCPCPRRLCSRTPDFQSGKPGASPGGDAFSIFPNSRVAQAAVHRPLKPGVAVQVRARVPYFFGNQLFSTEKTVTLNAERFGATHHSILNHSMVACHQLSPTMP